MQDRQYAGSTKPPALPQNGKPGMGNLRRPSNNQKPPATGLLIKLLIAAVLLGLAVWGASAAINSLRDNQVRQSIAQYQDVFAPNTFINDIPLAGLAPQAAFDNVKSIMEQRINSWALSINFNGHTFANLNYGSLGITISDQELSQLLTEAWIISRTGNVHQQREAIDRLSHTPLRLSTTKAELDASRLDNILSQIAPYLTAAPIDAAILAFQPDEQEPFLFQNEKAGMSFDVATNKEAILSLANAGQSGGYELQVNSIPPKVTRAELQQSVSLLTTITTAIDKNSDDKRNHNISFSFSKFNGMILSPGQTFSFNRVVGPRTLSAGFAEAEEYAYGDLVYGVGGGVCQASTTLYQAAVTAGLSISKRYPHSGPVSYTQLGQDATVYMIKGYEIDFAFKNDTSSNIYIAARVRPAQRNSRQLVSEVRIYGQSLGDGVSYRLRSQVVETLPIPDERKIELDQSGTKATYTDQEVLKSKGREGQVIETYLEKLINGVLVEQPRLISSDTFKARPPVYYRGVTKREQ